MAWLSGLAGKAENLLNKIDQNTAAVLNKDKYDVPQSLIEVTWIPPQTCLDESTVVKNNHESLKHIPYIRSTPNLRSLTPTNAGTSEDELITFLNTPNASPRRPVEECIMLPATPLSVLTEHATDNTDTVSEVSIHSRCISPALTHTSVDVPESNCELEINAQNEIVLLGNDVQTLNMGINNDITTKFIESEENNTAEQFNVPQEQCTYELKQEEKELNKCNTLSKIQYAGKRLHGLERDLEKKNELLGKRETDHQKEMAALNEKLQILESEKTHLSKQIIDLQFTLERNRLELHLTRSELEQHRARALKTLQEKEKLIAELKTNVTLGVDDASFMELNQLRQERDILREENQQVCEQFRIVREELINADLKLEKMREESIKANMQVQEILATERYRRLDAEEDARLHSEASSIY